MIDIVTPALVAFERVVSGALKNGAIDEEELNMLQALHLETLNELTGIDHRMEAEHRSLVERSLFEEINEQNLLARSATLFLIDDIIADEALDKRRQPLLELAISGRHRQHSL